MLKNIAAAWEYRISNRMYRLWGLPFMPVVPYPARATKLTLDLNLTGCWWRPTFTHRKTLSEAARRDGETIWWARWLWFQVSYSRFL